MIPLFHGMIFASILFVVGLFGVMIRRNLLFLFFSLMIMINGAVIALVVVGYHWQQPDGQIISILAIGGALSEACVGLALLVKLFFVRKTLNIESLSEMKG